MPARGKSTFHPEVSALNREAILDAADELLREQGCANISAVAVQADVSRVTVHAHFPTWEALLEAAVQRAVGRTVAALTGAGAENEPADRALERMITAAWQHLSDNEAMARAVSELLSPEAVTRTHQAALASIGEQVRRGQAEGSFRTDLPVDWLTHASIALMHECNDGVVTGRMDRDDALRIITASICDLLTGGCGLVGDPRMGNPVPS